MEVECELQNGSRWISRGAQIPFAAGSAPASERLPLNDANGIVVMIGPFLQYKDLFRLELGLGYGYSYDASKDAHD